MLKLKKVAVTGGLSSGKSTVCQLFKQLGAYTVSADEIVHQLLSPKTVLGQQVINLLGNEVISNEKFNRQAIAERVFRDEHLLHGLEQLLHPAVDVEMKKQYELAKQQGSPLFVAEIPLLFEAGHNTDWFDAIIAMDTPEDLCMAHFQAKGGSIEEYHRRMKRQLPSQDKALRADYTISNKRGLSELKSPVSDLFYLLTQEELHPDEPRRTNPS